MCDCEEIENEISEKWPAEDMACCGGNPCNYWCEKSAELPDCAEPEEDYSCCCPVCGKLICNWCS